MILKLNFILPLFIELSLYYFLLQEFIEVTKKCVE